VNEIYFAVLFSPFIVFVRPLLNEIKDFEISVV